MNHEEAKTILLLYRPGTADSNDPQIAEALILAKQDADLGAWLERQNLLQKIIREKFQQIEPPPGLKEQIIAALPPAPEKILFLSRYAVLAAAAMVIAFITVAFLWTRSRHPGTNSLANYDRQMVGLAQRAYAMDLVTSDPAKIHAYFGQTHAPDFILPSGLRDIAMTGCAVESWQGAHVSMICFRTGKQHLAAGQSSDVWLFVVDPAAVPNTNPSSSPQLAKMDRVAMANWTQDGKLYLLATLGDENTIKTLL